MLRHLRTEFLSKATDALIAISLGFVLAGQSHASDGEEAWSDLKEELFQGRTIEEGNSSIVLHAPNQAADAALVPIVVRLAPNVVRNIRSMTLIVDRNPMPVAAKFEFSEAYRDHVEIGERVIATRIRVDNFSNVRVISELNDGRLQMSKQFVFGAGGCSSPSAKDADSALSNLGQIRIREKHDDNHAKAWREARVMIRHPNYTGMQMDAASGSFTPARYIEKLSVSANEQLLFHVTGGISLSENPMVRFTYGAKAKSEISVHVKDSDGAVFQSTLSGSSGS